MKLALSTNWCNRRIADGAEIAEKALELGFDELELGFRTSIESVAGFRSMLFKMPVGSIHAFCPVPLSAPAGHPELFQLASFSRAERELARAHVIKNIRFAAEIGADTVVLHAGRVAFNSLFSYNDSTRLRDVFKKCANKIEAKAYSALLAKAWRIRRRRGNALMKSFLATLESIAGILEENHITLALENLPYLEGFPNEAETSAIIKHFKDSPVKAWFDTGHHRVRHMLGWIKPEVPGLDEPDTLSSRYAGMHLNDVVDYMDDHLAPGEGRVDFAALKDLAHSVKHVVVEPNGDVTEDSLSRAVAMLRRIY